MTLCSRHAGKNSTLLLRRFKKLTKKVARPRRDCLIEASELLSRMLKRNKIVHSVLNAKFHEQEPRSWPKLVKRFSHYRNQHGWTRHDIKLGQGVAEQGLFVIGTERHESRRIDRQLRGRCARQGDPGLSKCFVSLEDDLMRLFADAELISFSRKIYGRGRRARAPRAQLVD